MRDEHDLDCELEPEENEAEREQVEYERDLERPVDLLLDRDRVCERFDDTDEHEHDRCDECDRLVRLNPLCVFLLLTSSF